MVLPAEDVDHGADRSLGRADAAGRDMSTLVAQARDGDELAFEEIVRLTYHDTYTLAVKLTGDPEDARDVVQEAYLRAHRGLGRFRGDAQFSTWLYRITSNCAGASARTRPG